MTEFYKQLNMLCRDILQKAPPPMAKSRLPSAVPVVVAKALLGGR